eukprot:XP_016663494.1 PREDICTED: uncharacterized protein LOC107884907 [Acyrthosiphon pisum]
MTPVTIKICMFMLQGLSLSVFATPLIWEPEWSAIVVPITQSPATDRQSRLTAQSKDFRRFNHLVSLTDSESVGTVTEAPHLYSTCRGFSCRDLNRNVEDRHDNKNRNGQNLQETKRRGNNHQSEKKRCGGKNQQNCGKNQHQKQSDTNRCEKRCGKNQGKKHCGEKRNGQSRHDTTHCNRQNNPQNNMKNGNKRRKFVVDNKVIINVNDDRTPVPTVIKVNDDRTSGPTVIKVNDDRTPGPTVINVNDGQTTGPTLLSRIETTVATVQVSIVPQRVGHSCSCSSVHSFRHSDIVWLSLLTICIAIIFYIYKVYFISDRYHSIMY